ncbi:putative C-S lyase [Acetobacteraceae bacterium H6797]|nr:putative C-S lyase [Acetobacteraceae bacterium H6797]
MQHDFDTVIDRHGTGSLKWQRYAEEVLPMWVADADFAVSPAITAAIRARLDHPVFGYASADAGLRQTIVTAMAETYGWKIEPEHLLFIPGVVTAFNMALKALLQPGDGVLVQTPAYPPILQAHRNWGLTPVEHVMHPGPHGDYALDLEAFDEAAAASRAFLLCNPHNPTGRVFTRAELAHMAETCLARDLIIIADEIHCDLLFDGRRHIPIASLSPEIAARTITLMSASKTFNIAGLKAAFAIIPDKALRDRVAAAHLGLVGSVNVLGLEATRAAFAEGTPWKDDLVAYLEGNRDWLEEAVRRRLPGIAFRKPEGTYLAWLDCKGIGLNEEAYDFFLRKAKVAFNPGPEFGTPGRDFVRLNFACPRATLEEGVARMERAIKARR